MEATLKHLAIEARARLIWGTPKSKVEQWLTSQGLPAGQVQIIVETAWRERNAEIRKMGIRDVVIASLSLGGCGLAFIYPAYLSGRSGGSGSGWGLIMLLFLFGTWRIIRGIDRVIEGGKIQGSIPDMES